LPVADHLLQWPAAAAGLVCSTEQRSLSSPVVVAPVVVTTPLPVEMVETVEAQPEQLELLLR
jgi:hypothetical protein